MLIFFSEITKAFEGLLLLKAFRMDRFAAGATIFIQRVFGESFLQADFSLLEVVEKESRATAPLLLCSMPGHDASSKVDDIAQKLSRKNYKYLQKPVLFVTVITKKRRDDL